MAETAADLVARLRADTPAALLRDVLARLDENVDALGALGRDADAEVAATLELCARVARALDGQRDGEEG